MTRVDRSLKRALDLGVSAVGLLCLGWVVLLTLIAARLSTGMPGLYRQTRVGRNGALFTLFKVRTMRIVEGVSTTSTTALDPRITPLGRWLRRTKLDELPQLFNVLRGDMSLVGPRPDVPGFADQLTGDARRILSVRPGITGPATLRFRNEEEILAAQDDPVAYNRDVLFPEKVRINLDYVDSYSFDRDLVYIAKTILG